MLRLMVLAWVPIVASAAWAQDGFLTTSFGNGERCEHPGTLKAENNVLRFDLTALPAGTRIMRAVLRVSEKGHQTGAAVRLIQVEGAAAKALALRAPFFDCFDATDAVRTWVAKPESNNGLKIERGGGLQFGEAVLEVSYAGRLGKPLAPVTELKALHQSGQTFLTWKEIADPVGADAPAFGDFEKAVLDARRERRIVYRVYRDTKPITVASLGEAELAREAPEALSCWNLLAIQNTEHANQGTPTKNSELRPGYNLSIGYVMTRYRIIEGGEPLPRATGLAVFTVTAPGKRYYAVTASVNGCEGVVQLGAGSSLEQPVDENVSAFPATVYQRTTREGQDRNSPEVEVFNTWIEPPYHNVPFVSEVSIVRWKDLPKGDAKQRLPLFVNSGTYGCTATELASPGWHAARRHVKGAFTVGVSQGGLWEGFHECLGTLKGYDDGVVHNYPQRRVLAAAQWAAQNAAFCVDPERVHYWAQHGGWALRYGDLFTAVMSEGHCNLAIGKEPQKHGPSWGPYPKSTQNWLGIDQWEYMDLPKWVRENPSVELPYWLCWPAYGAYPNHTVGDFGFMPWPEMLHAMITTKRAFAACWSSNGPGPVGPLRELLPRLRLHQSLPAFSNCSLDHSIGDGDHADAEKGGGVNLYQIWEPENLVDEADRWEITLDLRADCPRERLSSDVTPRRCQRFKAKPGDKFKWTNTNLGENKEIQSGEASADKWGLVTLEKVVISRGKNRVRIVR